MPHWLSLAAVAIGPFLLIACAVTSGVADETLSGSRRHALVPPEELRAHCPKLTSMIMASIEHVKSLREKARAEAAPPATVAAALERVFGAKGKSTSAVNDMAKERVRAARINAALQANGCAAVDVEALSMPEATHVTKTK